MPARTLPRALVATWFGAAAVLACGADAPSPPQASLASPREDAAGGFTTDGDAEPTTCGTLADGSTCACVDVPLVLDPPTLYFVLDRSGSVSDELWTATRVAVGQVMRALGPRARFGATVFPAPSQSGCAAGREILAPTAGDPPSNGHDGPTTRALLALTASMPPREGGTPLTPTLAELRGRLAAEPRAAVVLATDGAPNCNPSASCSADRCLANLEGVAGCTPRGPSCCQAPYGAPESCIDDAGSVSAVADLRRSGVATYVLGAPGSAGYAELLSSLARAGGTARAEADAYYRVDESAALGAALRSIAGAASGTCAFDLGAPPREPDLLNVQLDGEAVPRLVAADGGDDGRDGWVLEGATVRLVGEACGKVLRGDALSVRILGGCPSLVR